MPIDLDPGPLEIGPLRLTAEQAAQLRRSASEIACLGPDDEPLGFWLTAEQYRTMRHAAYAEIKRRMDQPENHPAHAAALAGLDYSGGPAAVLQRVLGRWEEAGLTPGRMDAADDAGRLGKAA